MTASTLERPERTKTTVFFHYFGWDFWRAFRMWESSFFILVLPTALYLMIGRQEALLDMPYGKGNYTAYIMTSMAIYGAVIATTSVSSAAVVERQSGWNRQLAMTQLTDGMFIGAKLLSGLVFALMPTVLILIVGAFTGAEYDSIGIWFATAGLTLLGSLPFAFYGLAVALLFRATSAVSIASTLLVVFAFLGNLFIPLEGVMLTIAKFTPMYGVGMLAHWPQAEGQLSPSNDAIAEAAATGMPPEIETDSIWLILANIGSWTLIFLALCWLGSRLSRRR